MYVIKTFLSSASSGLYSVGTRETELTEYDVKAGFNKGMLRIVVPEELIQAELKVYNLFGQEIYCANMDQTENMVHLCSNSNFYIVVIQSINIFLSKKVLAF